MTFTTTFISGGEITLTLRHIGAKTCRFTIECRDGKFDNIFMTTSLFNKLLTSGVENSKLCLENVEINGTTQTYIAAQIVSRF